MDDKTKFLNRILEIRKNLIIQNTKLIAELNNKKNKLSKLYLESNEDNKKDIKTEIQNIDLEILKLKEEIQGKTTLKMLDKIESLKDVSSVSYSAEGMKVVTKDIDMRIGNRYYNIGKYVIRIDYNMGLNINRLDGIVIKGSYHNIVHPFITTGYACFGDWEHDIDCAIKMGGIYTLVTASILLLKCGKGEPYMNHSDFYRELKEVVNHHTLNPNGFEDVA